MDVRKREKRSSDLSLHETNRQLESPRLELNQANRWADQAKRERISLHGELELSVEQEIAKKLRNYEESVAKRQKN